MCFFYSEQHVIKISGDEAEKEAQRKGQVRKITGCVDRKDRVFTYLGHTRLKLLQFKTFKLDYFLCVS